MKKYISILLSATLLFASALTVSCEDTPVEAQEYTISISGGPGGSAQATIDGTTADKALEGDNVSLLATPDKGYKFGGWTVESGGAKLSDSAANPSVFTMPASDVSIKAEFIEDSGPAYKIIVTDNGFGSAEATIDGNVITEAPEGITITLSATADDGYELINWTVVTGGVELSNPSGSPATFTMPANNVSFNAEFAEPEINVFDEIVDPLFKEKCLPFDADNDGVLSRSEAAKVVSLNLGGLEDIESLAGIEYFTGLETLNCYENRLTTLDLSNNILLEYLNCSDNLLTELFLPESATLINLYCRNNALTSFDLSNHTELINLLCENNALTSLDLSENTKLLEVNCHTNELSIFDISENLELQYIFCNDNLISELDVSQHTKLAWLSCHNNAIPSLTLPNTTSLMNVLCYNNRMTALDISNMPTNLGTYYDVLCGMQTSDGTTAQSIRLRMRADQKDRWENDLKGRSENRDVITRVIGEDIFEFIDDPAFMTYCERFDYNTDGILSPEEVRQVGALSLAGLDIASLAGIEHFTEITVLTCPNNMLTTLDLSKNTKLTTVICLSNRLTSLNISGCTQLRELVAFDNRMTELNASGMADPAGYNLLCGQQTSDGSAAQTLTLTLRPEQKTQWNNALRTESQNTGVVLSDAYKGPDVFAAMTDDAFKTFCQQFDSDNDGILSTMEAEEVTSLNVASMGIGSLAGIEYFTEITSLNCATNQLTTLDVSGLEELATLACQSNQLTSLDISGCTALNNLMCAYNRMATLDASDMADPDTYTIMCGNQTSDGTTPLTITLTLRDEQKPQWENLRRAVLNTGVVLAD